MYETCKVDNLPFKHKTIVASCWWDVKSLKKSTHIAYMSRLGNGNVCGQFYVKKSLKRYEI